jgi:flagellar biosynthesis/type III secretory pathway protein FliH
MTDMQRFDHNMPDEEGIFVLASDAEAAIRAAVEVVTERRVAAVGDIAKQVAEASERGRSKGYEEGYWTGNKSGYTNGHKDGGLDMLAKCIEVVTEMPLPEDLWPDWGGEYGIKSQVLTALRALQEKP